MVGGQSVRSSTARPLLSVHVRRLWIENVQLVQNSRSNPAERRILLDRNGAFYRHCQARNSPS